MRPIAPCEAIPHQTYMKIDIVKAGRDPNTTHSHGVTLKIHCAQGYGLNIGENNTARCNRGRWKPEKPHCRICKQSIHTVFIII